MNSQQILRAYSINEVSKKMNIPSGTIRQWEKDLTGLLVIPRTKQGARYYTEEEIRLLKKVKEMRGKNVSKEMIRSLLERHINSGCSEPTSERFETPGTELTIQNSNADPIISQAGNDNNLEDFFNKMETYKMELMNELKKEMARNRTDLIDEIKNELSSTSLHTVKELSKSIQRSNDKRKAETQEISNAILEASEHTSETFATLSDDIARSSKGTYEQLSKRITESAKAAAKDNKNVLNKVTQTVGEAKNDIRNLANSLEEQQGQVIELVTELKESTEEIKHREEVFQTMLSSFREAAAAKSKKKKWWQVWN